MTKTLITCPHCNQPTTIETRCGVCGETIRYASGEMTEPEYLAALNEIWELFDAEPGTPEAERLVALINKVEKYEDEHYPMRAKTMTNYQKFEYFLVTAFWGLFLFMVFKDPDPRESLQYGAGVLACIALLRSIQARRK